jgi:hypothetical protein
MRHGDALINAAQPKGPRSMLAVIVMLGEEHKFGVIRCEYVDFQWVTVDEYPGYGRAVEAALEVARSIQLPAPW